MAYPFASSGGLFGNISKNYDIAIANGAWKFGNKIADAFPEAGTLHSNGGGPDNHMPYWLHEFYTGRGGPPKGWALVFHYVELPWAWMMARGASARKPPLPICEPPSFARAGPPSPCRAPCRPRHVACRTGKRTLPFACPAAVVRSCCCFSCLLICARAGTTVRRDGVVGVCCMRPCATCAGEVLAKSTAYGGARMQIKPLVAREPTPAFLAGISRSHMGDRCEEACDAKEKVYKQRGEVSMFLYVGPFFGAVIPAWFGFYFVHCYSDLRRKSVCLRTALVGLGPARSRDPPPPPPPSHARAYAPSVHVVAAMACDFPGACTSPLFFGGVFLVFADRCLQFDATRLPTPLLPCVFSPNGITAVGYRHKASNVAACDACVCKGMGGLLNSGEIANTTEKEKDLLNKQAGSTIFKQQQHQLQMQRFENDKAGRGSKTDAELDGREARPS